MKQWMAELLERRVPSKAIAYMTGELVDDHHSLIRLVTDLLTEMPDKDLKFIFLDKITYIRGWDKGVKYLADAGMLENTVLVITESDMVIIKEARMRLPGRRGISEKVDFHLYPLSFLEYVKLSKRISHDEVDLLTGTQELPHIELLDRLYEEFDKYLSHDLSIDHPKTIADYVALLVSMDATFIQAALLEDKLAASPKKAKKLMFADPFIFHAVHSWVKPCKDPFHEQLKQITKYPNGLILTKLRQEWEIHGTPTMPLPLALLRIDPTGEQVPRQDLLSL